MASTTHTDTLLVGAGPIGLELAVAIKRRGIDYLQLDAGVIGATMDWWAPGTQFFSSPERIKIAGVPIVTRDQQKATREEYLAYLRGVVDQFGLKVSTFERVIAAGLTGEGFTIETERRGGGGREIVARRVVLAIGDMHAPKLLGVPGEDLPHVSHYLADPHAYVGRRVVIVGGRNSAVEAAIRLYRVGADVTIVYRRTVFPKKVKYWLRPELIWLIDTGRVGFVPDAVVSSIGPDRVELARSPLAEDAPIDDEWTGEVAADDVLLMTGYRQDGSLFDQLGVEREGIGQRPVLDEQTMETTVPGVYVIGTATAGTQASGVSTFIENSHVHAERVAAALDGERAELENVEWQLEES